MLRPGADFSRRCARIAGRLLPNGACRIGFFTVPLKAIGSLSWQCSLEAPQAKTAAQELTGSSLRCARRGFAWTGGRAARI
jgi:hypothetical protein